MPIMTIMASIMNNTMMQPPQIAKYNQGLIIWLKSYLTFKGGKFIATKEMFS